MSHQQQKRVSCAQENGEHADGSSKKPRTTLAIQDDGVVVVKEERPAQGGEVASPGAVVGEGAVVSVAVAQDMQEPQISIRLAVSSLHCHACVLPLKPPTFRCEAGHAVCRGCRDVHAQACAAAAAGAGGYVNCPGLDSILRDAKVPCIYAAFGCTSWVVYHEAAEHHRSCRCAPCFCPDPGCEHHASPLSLADHFAGTHGWPIVRVVYGKPCVVPAVPAPLTQQGGKPVVLVGEEDGSVFLVIPTALAAATAVSLVCVRKCGDAAAGGAAQFRCKLWAEVAGNKENLALVTSMVRSTDLAGGFVAAEQGMFLVVPPELLHDESGEPAALMIRVDKAGAGAASARSSRSPSVSTPPSSLPRRLQQ